MARRPKRPAVPRAALDYFERKDLRVGFDYRDVWGQEHAHAFTVAKAMQLDLLDDIKASLTKMMDEGRPYRAFARDITPILQRRGWWGRREVTDPKTGERVEAQLGSPRRLRTIYNANMRSARAAGQWERIQRTKALRPYLLYLLGPAREHRPQHVAWAGTLLAVDHPWWQDHTPPNAWGCVCRIRQVGVEEAERLQRDGVQDPTAGQEINPETGLPTGRRVERKTPVTTEAPARDPRRWVNKRTGEILTIDRGLDPAWAGNPGMDRVRELRAHLMSRVVSADQQLAAAAASQVVRGPLMADWIREPKGEIPVGAIPRDIQRAIGARSQVVRLSPESYTKQDGTHPELTLADYARLPDLIRRGIVIRQDGQRLVFFRRVDDAWWKAVVKITEDEERAYLVSFHRASARELRRERDRGTVIRSVER